MGESRLVGAFGAVSTWFYGEAYANLVRGNQTPLQAGMCFSDEPMIVIPGEFGIRLEDCFYMTDSGPKFFTEPSPSIDRPVA